MMGDTVSKNKNKGMEGEGKDAFALEMRRQEGLVARRSVRRDVVRETLAVMEERVADRHGDVLAIQGGNGNKRELLQDLVGDEMERVANGSISVPRYDPALKTGQVIYLYVGTHWGRLDNERFFQLVRKCCQRMGLPKSKVQSRIILTPEHAKRLLRALQDNIQKYESNFGQIEVQSNKLPMNFGGNTAKA